MRFESIQRSRPELLVVRQVLGGFAHRLRRESREALLPALLRPNQPGGFEHAEVLDDGRHRQAVYLGELRGSLLLQRSSPQNVASILIGKGAEDGVETHRLVNHTVYYTEWFIYFPPVVAIPWMNVFWAKKKRRMIGKVKTVAAAINCAKKPP